MSQARSVNEPGAEHPRRHELVGLRGTGYFASRHAQPARLDAMEQFGADDSRTPCLDGM
ncbi:hypothetical protein BGZ63DRAFT_388681 [Mariannaea sp. PMI_226]|nr:hypothetical protein BGZ63DRAFT_388681 [Mariannaea sp. PMI_226]